MRKLWIGVFGAAFTSMVIMGAGIAGEKATREECRQMCLKAALMVKAEGKDAALEQISDKSGEFVWKDSYVFATDKNGMVLAHPFMPEMKGKNFLWLIDIKASGPIKEGWVGYEWAKPGEEKPSHKQSYLYPVDGVDIVFIAGVYMD